MSGDSVSLTITIHEPEGIAAESFVKRLADSPGELGAIIWDSLLERYRETVIRLGSSSSDRPFRVSFDLSYPGASGEGRGDPE